VSDVARDRFTAALIEERIPCTTAYLDSIDKKLKRKKSPKYSRGLSLGMGSRNVVIGCGLTD
jgi:hypothetical protein